MSDLSALDVLLLAAVGRILIYLWMEFPLPQRFDESKFGQLHRCSLCSGTWGFSIIFLIYGVDIFGMMGIQSNTWIGGFMTGGLVSFLFWVFEAGWKSRFETIILE